MIKAVSIITLSCLCTISLYGLGLSGISYKPDSAKIIFEQRINTASGNSRIKADAHYEYGVFLDDNGNTEEAIGHIKTALQLATQLSIDSLIAKTANHLGSIYWIEGDCPTSTQYYETALKSAEESSNLEMIAIIKMNLSGNYSTSGQNEKAIEYALAALEIRENANNINGICFDYIMLGEIFHSTGNIQKWKDYVHKAYLLKDNKQCAVVSDVVMIYNNLGRIAEAEKEFDRALACYDTIMQVSKPANYTQGMGISLLNSALIKQMQSKPGEALKLATRSEQYLGEVPYFVMATLNTKAQILKELGQYNEALDLVKENIRNENMPLYPVIKQDCLNLLYELNFVLKNYQRAYNWNDTLRTYEDKLRKEENQKNIEELETQYQTERKEQQIELLTAENQIRKQRIILFIIVSFLLVVAIIAGVLDFIKRKKRNAEKQQTLKQQLLRMQMNPHFLFNALGSIQNYMHRNETKKAAGYLNNFASLTRSILEHTTMDFISLGDEIKALENYLELEQMRTNHSFMYQFNYPDNIDVEFIELPPMLIQPFVENSVKHGLRNLNYPGLLTINFQEEDNILSVTITDNGHGIEPKQNDKSEHRSMSMEIFNKRQKILSRQLKKNIYFSVKNRKDANPEETGTCVEIRIPVKP
ncbi:tetratricopeptide repeat protein [Marinifilum fragile]|uniref:tetratricopeptide repeat-containing sensor histidine kinase n=1 Tax=Marinifilum fragile TaxID=570161 RepID=UPI002AA62765|nr:tetratricopeptide repeat protein [Marinifilum fragile]